MLGTNFRLGMRQIICTRPALVIFIELIHRTKKLIVSSVYRPLDFVPGPALKRDLFTTSTTATI